MSLTAFQRYRRIHQVEEMKPENIRKTQEEASKEEVKVVEEVNNFTDAPLVPEEPVKEEKPATKTAARRKSK